MQNRPARRPSPSQAKLNRLRKLVRAGITSKSKVSSASEILLPNMNYILSRIPYLGLLGGRAGAATLCLARVAKPRERVGKNFGAA